MAYGLPLSGDGDERCLSMLNAVEETISRQLRACKASLSKRRVLEGYCLLKLQYINAKFCSENNNSFFAHDTRHNL